MNRKLTTGLALAAAGLGTVPIAASGQPNKPNKPDKQASALTLSATPNPTVFGRASALSGRLTGNNRAGQTVGLEADPYPLDRYSAAGSATTAPNGNFSFQVRPRLNTRYRVRQGNTLSPPVTVLVRIRVSMRPDDFTPRAGRRVLFSGRACPEHDGARVAIQRLTRLGWRTVKRTVLERATRCSTYGTRVRMRRDATLRTVVAGDSDHARGISRRRRVDVH